MPVSVMVQAIPSAITVSSALVERDIAGATTTPTKSKEIVTTFPGAYLIKFHLRAASHAGQVYRNGTAVGLRQTTDSAAGVEFSETIGGWSKGDLCQLYAWTNAGTAAGFVSGFRILGSYSNSNVPIPTGRVTVDANV